MARKADIPIWRSLQSNRQFEDLEILLSLGCAAAYPNDKELSSVQYLPLSTPKQKKFFYKLFVYQDIPNER